MTNQQIERYYSIFDHLEATRTKGFFQRSKSDQFLHHWQEFEGDLEIVLKELEDPLENHEEETIITAVPRIIRAVLDYKVRTVTPNIEEILEYSTNLAINSFRTWKISGEEIDEFKKKIVESGNAPLLTHAITQKEDYVSWNSYHPALSQVSTEEILKQTRKDNILLIALAHGGIPAGIDVYLRYCDQSKGNASVFYPVRFSNRKSNDESPKLTEKEIEKLRALSKYRRVVLFDEDSATGTTMEIAGDYFRDLLKNKKGIITRVNDSA